MTNKGETEEEKKDEEVKLTVETKGDECLSSLSVETQFEDHNDVQGENQRDPGAEWGTARFVGPLTYSTCTILSIGGIFLILFPIGIFAFLCPCDKKNVYRVDGKYYDEHDNYLGDGNKVVGFRRLSFRPTGGHH
jgi:hypothetical protein